MNNEVVIPTHHAIVRVRERAKGVVKVKAFLDHLWMTGRPLHPRELERKRKRYSPACDYRLAEWRGMRFIVVREGSFYITLIRIRDRKADQGA